MLVTDYRSKEGVHCFLARQMKQEPRGGGRGWWGGKESAEVNKKDGVVSFFLITLGTSGETSEVGWRPFSRCLEIPASNCGHPQKFKPVGQCGFSQ